MCLIGIAWRVDPQVPLLIAANRDEFHDRPTAAAAPWPTPAGVYGGRDLRAGGGWLLLGPGPRLAAVTNVREAAAPPAAAPSRGRLVANFAASQQSAEDGAHSVMQQAAAYAAFNLLLFDGHQLWFVSNRPQPECRKIEPGLHTLSNASLDSDWPKCRRLQARMAEVLSRAEPRPDTRRETLLTALADRRPAADAELPDTGLPRALERSLSPPFIAGPRYGTRSSTLVQIDRLGQVDFFERRFDADGPCCGETRAQLAPGE
jgi:Uncharacterized conserved protein